MEKQFLNKSIVTKLSPGPSFDSVANVKNRCLRKVVLVKYEDGNYQEYIIGIKKVEFLSPTISYYPKNTILVHLNKLVLYGPPEMYLDCASIYIGLDKFSPYNISSSNEMAVVCTPEAHDPNCFIPAGYCNRKILYSEIGLDLNIHLFG